MKSIIYYTDNNIDINIWLTAQKYIRDSKLPIFSSSLLPMPFGKNQVIDGKRSYPTMIKQIISALKRATGKYVFFCEHDVLYHKSHFDFTPTKDDVFFYNENVWRWRYGEKTAIRHHRMISLSSLCANRDFVLDHYERRLKTITERNLMGLEGHEPKWARIMGYEPGTKKIKRGGFSDDNFETWSSKFPNIDIRHNKTFSSPKTKINEFKHKPQWWSEISINEIPEWDLIKIFDLNRG